MRAVRGFGAIPAVASSAFSRAAYAAAPTLAAVAERLRPVLPFDWPLSAGPQPPAEILAGFPRYQATASAMRLRSRSLHESAFRVRSAELDAYVAAHVTADTTRMRRWMAAGTGVIYACPHYGPFLLGALLVATLGAPGSPSHVFYDPPGAVPDNRRFDELFQRFADRLNVLHNEPRDLVRAMRALKNRQCLSIMFDVVQRPADSMFVPFFDRLYPAMGGAAYLSLQSGAPVVPAYVVPEAGRKARVVFGQPIEPGAFTSADRDKNVYDMTRALFSDFQQQLARAPWHWIYWGNVAAASRLDPHAQRSHAALVAEIGRRCRAVPALLRHSPLLRALIESGPAAPTHPLQRDR